MRRTIRLTENNLSRIVKKVLSENLNNKTNGFALYTQILDNYVCTI